MIKASGKALSAHYHPDKETGNAAKFREIREALEILCDPEKRAAHDYALAHGHNGTANQGTPGEQQYRQAQAQPGRPVWMNGIGWVIVPPDMPGTFPSDRPPAYPDPYRNLENMAQEAAHEMAHDIVDQLLQNMFRGRRR